MSILSSERSMCNKMVYDFNGAIAPINNAKHTIRSKQNEAQTLLNSLTSSSQSAINSAISDLTSQVNDIVPAATLSDMQALKNFIENCEYLSGLSPIAAMLSALDAIYNKIDDFLDNIGGTVPEFNIGKITSLINDLLRTRGITDVLKNLDKLLNCIEMYCGGEYPDQLTNMTIAVGDAYSDLNITSDPASSDYGLFDFNTLYDNAGLSSTQKTQINQVTAAIDGEKSRSETTIASAITIYKENLLT